MQAFYVGKQYRRALALLKASELVEADMRCRYLAARCLANTKEWDECLSIMGGADPSDADMIGLQVIFFSAPCTIQNLACLAAILASDRESFTA